MISIVKTLEFVLKPCADYGKMSLSLSTQLDKLSGLKGNQRIFVHKKCISNSRKITLIFASSIFITSAFSQNHSLPALSCDLYTSLENGLYETVGGLEIDVRGSMSIYSDQGEHHPFLEDSSHSAILSNVEYHIEIPNQLGRAQSVSLGTLKVPRQPDRLVQLAYDPQAPLEFNSVFRIGTPLTQEGTKKFGKYIDYIASCFKF